MKIKEDSGETLHDQLTSCLQEHGLKIAQVDFVTGETVTFADVLHGAETLAAELRSRGLRPGHVAMIIGENSVHYTWVLLGVMRTGATPHLVNPRSTQRELRHAVSLSRPLLVLVSCGLAAVAEEPCLPHVLLWGASGLGGVTGGYELSSPSRVQEQLLPSGPGGPSAGDGVGLLLSSSGTTGLPKAVMLTHNNLLASLRVGPLGGCIQLRPGDVVLGILPFCHVFGVLLSLTALSVGTPVVAVAKFPGVAGLLSGVRRHGCTALVLVPSLLASLAEHPDFSAAGLPALRCIQTGGSPLSTGVQAEVRRRLPGVCLIHAYGMTEAGATLLVAETRHDKAGCAGLPMHELQYKIAHPVTGEAVPPGERGELCVRSPTTMKGYLHNPEATAETLDAQGWLHTGDVAYVDRDGYYFIVERLKFIFKYNGHQVSPTELEMLLCQHPGVREAAVLGVPHRYGEAPLALVVLAEGATVSPSKLQDYVEGKVEPHKKLRGGVHFVESLPRNNTGKLQREQLPRLLETVRQATSR